MSLMFVVLGVSWPGAAVPPHAAGAYEALQFAVSVAIVALIALWARGIERQWAADRAAKVVPFRLPTPVPQPPSHRSTWGYRLRAD